MFRAPEGPGAAGEPAADDRRLLADHLAGHPDAFAALVRRHRDRLWAVALRTLGDREEAADALQDALVSAFRNAGSYRGDAEVTTWLHRVVVNACIDRMRRRQARPTTPMDGREFAARRDEHAATEARIDVRAALLQLPEAQRVAIVLVDIEDLSVAEAARVLGVAEGTVKSRCARGRLALAALLRPEAAWADVDRTRNRRRRPGVGVDGAGVDGFGVDGAGVDGAGRGPVATAGPDGPPPARGRRAAPINDTEGW